ncbi:MMB_0454 family protein [Mycoplasmopsis caviae]
MNLITTNCGLNLSYSITENVFNQLINQCFDEIKDVKLLTKQEFHSTKNKQMFSFEIDIKIRKGIGIQQLIENIKHRIRISLFRFIRY